MFDETFEGTCAAPPTCASGQTMTACTCLYEPKADDAFATNRVGCDELDTMTTPRTPQDDYCEPGGGGTTPNIACMMPGMYRTRGTPMPITLYGVVDVFGNGPDAAMITVEVYRANDDGTLGELVGSSAPSDPAHPCATEEVEYRAGDPAGMRSLGYYEIAGVPTETPLILKQSGPSDTWTDLYTYNFEISNAEVAASPAMDPMCATAPAAPRFRYKARILAAADYDSIPLTAGLIGGVPPGNGAIAGEIHDCDDVRLEFAQIGVSPAPTTLTYFSSDPDNPLPDIGRLTDGTSRLGLYAGLDLPPGPVDVAAAARVGGQIVSLGWFRAQVFPDAVSVVTLRGLRPEQTGGM